MTTAFKVKWNRQQMMKTTYSHCNFNSVCTTSNTSGCRGLRLKGASFHLQGIRDGEGFRVSSK